MKRTAFAISIFMLLFPSIKIAAQKSFPDDLYYSQNLTLEIGASLGVMNCLTDLGGGKGSGKNFIKDINIENTTPTGSVYFSTAYKNAFVLRAETTWGIVKASDNVLKNVKESTQGRYERNLSFRSNIFEIMLVGEIHPRYFKKYSSNERLPRLSPYITGGLGYFIFNPQAKLNGTWIDLRPLCTEGQSFPDYPNRKFYKLKQLNFPVGAGFTYKLSTYVNFSTEVVYRILNTDYLDDVSTTYIDKSLFQKYLSPDLANAALLLYDRQKELDPSHITAVNDIRGNPKKNDAYFTLNFKIGFLF